jgi:hypothetical protein
MTRLYPCNILFLVSILLVQTLLRHFCFLYKLEIGVEKEATKHHVYLLFSWKATQVATAIFVLLEMSLEVVKNGGSIWYTSI